MNSTSNSTSFLAKEKQTLACILLLAHKQWFDKDVAEALQVSASTVMNVRKRFGAGGLDAALYDKPRPGAVRKLDGKQEALLVALACSQPDERETWTMQLLADKLVELNVVDEISDETVRRTLKKTRSSRGRRSSGALAGQPPTSYGVWKTCWISTPKPTILNGL